MKVEYFDCCHLYNECSDAGRCVNDKAHEEVCGYWRRYLSNGIVFYGKNPGLRHGNIFIQIAGRSFRISKRDKKDLSYEMDRPYIDALTAEFKRLGINHTIQAQGRCIIAGCPDNPANYKVDFTAGDYDYTIKNYNGYLLERDAVELILRELGGLIKLTANPSLTAPAQRTSIAYGSYYGRETVFVADDVPIVRAPGKSNTQPGQAPYKPTIVTDPAGGEWVQLTIWDMMQGGHNKS